MEQAVRGVLEVTEYGTRQITDSKGAEQRAWERLTPCTARKKNLGLAANHPIMSTPGAGPVLPRKKGTYHCIVKKKKKIL